MTSFRRGLLPGSLDWGPGPFWVCVLVSQSTGRRYVGQTDDLPRRLAEHNDPGHNLRKYTSRQKRPWGLVHVESFATRGEAMGREKWLKSGAGRDWLDREIGGASPPQAD
jgi:putative endonuclease